MPVSYDAIGNPLNDGTWTYTWQNGRQLAGMSKSGMTVSFKYNASGLRTRKIVNGVMTKYTLHGKNMVHMTVGGNELHFFYDAQGKPAVVVYNGTAYAYVKNLQGDIIAILDSAGTAVVRCTYDAWGAPTSTTGTMAATLGVLNPFRYRGYVYDEETELYYLKSRYFLPAVSRFIYADAVLGKSRVLAHNSYSYCYNNCIAHTDPDGFEAYWEIFEVHIRKAQIWMYDANNNILEPLVYETGPIYTTCESVLANGTIPVYYFDCEGNEHTGYVYDTDVIVWYGQSPERMEQYYQRYFGNFFYDRHAKINFLREGNSYQRMNAALNVMLKKFMDVVETEDNATVWVNNWYTPQTTYAVEVFQDHRGIAVDGIAGQDTIYELWRFFVDWYRNYVPYEPTN